MKKVSIITPVFNGRDYIIPYFRSLEKQTIYDYQLIIINDGSTDNTLDIILEYKKTLELNGAEVIVINNQVNRGAAACFNDGLPLVDSLYLLWLDADDLLTYDSLEKRVSFMEKYSELDLCICDAYRVDYPKYNEIKEIVEKPCKDNDYFCDVLRMKNVLWTPGSIFVKTSFMKKRIPNNNIYESTAGQNIQLLLPLLYKSKYKYMNEALYIIVSRYDSDSRQKRSFNIAWYRLLEYYNSTIYTLKNMNYLSKAEFITYSNIAINTYILSTVRFLLKEGYKKEALSYYKMLESTTKKEIKELHKINLIRGKLGAIKRKLFRNKQ